MWRIVFTSQARKDAKKLQASGLQSKAEEVLEILRMNPFQTPPRFEKLVGKLAGAFARRINVQHRIVYRIDEAEHTVVIHRLWTHYE